MTRSLLAGLVAAGVCASAGAQTTPGYLVIRVLLDGGSGPAAGGAGPGFGGPIGPMGPGAGPTGPGAGGPGGPIGGPGGGGPGQPPGRGGGFGSPDGGFPGAGPGGFGGQGFGGQSPVNNRNAVVAVVPFTNIYNAPLYRTSGPTAQAIKTKYGQTFLFQDNVSIQLYPQLGTSFEAQVRSLHERWRKNQSKFEDGYQFTLDAIQYGMVDEALTYAKELDNAIKIYQKEKSPPMNVAAFSKAFKEILPILDAAPAKSNDATSWKERLGLANVTESLHYSLVHGRDIDPKELDRRLTALETNFKAFYLWHALFGKAPKAPESRLIVVLLERSSEIDRFKTGLDGRPMEADAFYSPTYGIVALSPERLDDNARSFLKQVNAQYAVGWDREKLLRGEAPRAANRTPDEIKRMMTLALVDKALEEESDRAAVSREASRQLFAATGILPQNVLLPEWVEAGVSAFFERPKGPYIANGGTGTTMTVGLAPGYGYSNYILIRQFWELQRSNRLNPDPAELLIKTITDKYFDAVASGNDADPPPAPQQRNPSGAGPAGPIGGPGGPIGGPGGPIGGPGGRGPQGRGGPGQPPPGGIGEGLPGGNPDAMGPSGNEPTDPTSQERLRKATLEMKAHSTAWALTYFLSRTRIEGLHKFYQELARMPRDLRLDDKTVKLTFARCFNLLDKDGKDIDQNALKMLAEEWVSHMKVTPTAGKEIPINQTPGGGSGGPIGPGGIGGPMGPAGGFPGEGGPGGSRG